jgi:TRAP-type mannitol/chloroaromatic compound transport system permease large subunit
MSLFVLKGVVGDEFRLTEIYRAALPFVASDLAVITILSAFPVLVTVAPSLMAT